jgi:hypothetical protein
MAEPLAVRTKQDGILTITDGTTIYTVAVEAGDFNYTVPDHNVTSVLDRGRFTAAPILRRGDDQPVTGGFSVYHRDNPNATDLTILDLAMELSGTVAAGMTTTTANSDVKTYTLAFTIDGTWNGEADKTATFSNCVLRASVQEGDPNVVTVSFTTYQPTPIFT